MQAGAKLYMPAWAQFPWRLQRHLMTKNKLADDKNLIIESADRRRSADNKNLLTESADKNNFCWQETSSYTTCLRKGRLLVMRKLLKYLLKEKINKCNTKCVIAACYWGPWCICLWLVMIFSHLFENVIKQSVATWYNLEHETFLWQKSKVLTIYWQNLLTTCESAN